MTSGIMVSLTIKKRGLVANILRFIAIWEPAHVTGMRNLTGFVAPGPPVWDG